MNKLNNFVLAAALVNLGVASAQTAYPFAPHNTVKYVTYTNGVAQNTTHAYGNMLAGKRVKGETLISRSGTSATLCRGLCETSDGCIAFAEATDGVGCTLWSKIYSIYASTADNSYIMTDRQFKEYSGYTLSDTSISVDPNVSNPTTANACKQACAQTPKCQAAVWSGSCSLKSSYTGISALSGSTAYIMSGFNNADGGFTFNGALVDRHGPMQPKDRMISTDYAWGIRITDGNDLEISYRGIPAIQFKTGVASIQVLNNGQLRTTDVSGAVTDEPSTGCATGTWRLVFDNNQLKTVSTASATCYSYTMSSGSIGLWFWSDLTGKADTNFGNLTDYSPWGADSHLYFLDSGMSNENDVSGQSISRWMSLQQVNNGGVLDPVDYVGHGSMMTQLAKNTDFGIGYDHRIWNIKMTEGATDTFSERSVVRAMKVAYDNNADSSTTKVINFSGYFEGGSTYVDCAIQWLFKSNAAVVVAAGNSNATMTYNPYRLAVGSYDPHADNALASISSFSGYGPNVDLYAPASFINYRLQGTSVATGMTSVILGYAISKFTAQLKKNPKAAYDYLLSQTNAALLNPADDKIANNGSKNRALYVKNIADMATYPSTAPTSTRSAADLSQDFCGALGLNLTASSPNTANWTALINNASPTKMGVTVTTIYKPKCPGC